MRDEFSRKLRAIFGANVRALGEDLSKRTKDPTLIALVEARQAAYLRFAAGRNFADFAEGIKETKQATHERSRKWTEVDQPRLARRVQDVEEALTIPTIEHDDDGYGCEPHTSRRAVRGGGELEDRAVAGKSWARA